MLATLTQFLIVLNTHHFAAVVLIALFAVTPRRPPRD
jgi:hypothetical protein